MWWAEIAALESHPPPPWVENFPPPSRLRSRRDSVSRSPPNVPRKVRQLHRSETRRVHESTGDQQVCFDFWRWLKHTDT